MTITERMRSLEHFRGSTLCPPDFSDYWQQKLNMLRGLSVHRERVPFHNPAAVYENLQVIIPGGESVQARYIRPVGNGPFPTVLMFHDLGRPCRGWHHMTRFVGFGYAVIALENQLDASKTIEELSTEQLERMDLDALAAAFAALRLPETDTAHLAAWGEGFGGGLALLVSALLPVSVRCGCLHPMPAQLAPEKVYLDLINFAPLLHGPLLMGTALMDTVAPPEGQYAIYNRAACVKRHLVYPKYEHERINAFENELLKFLHL